MNENERHALERLGEKLVLTAADIWTDLPFDVESHNLSTEAAIETAIDKAAAGAENPPITPVTGGPGAGKTHLLARQRRRVQQAGGFLFYIEPKRQEGLWSDVTAAFLTGFAAPHETDRSQLTRLLAGLCEAASIPTDAVKRLLLDQDPDPALIGQVSGQIGRRFGPNGFDLNTLSVLKSLMLLSSQDFQHRYVGEAFLSSASEVEEGERRAWGIHPDRREPMVVAAEMSRLLSFVGPTLMAVDQIDGEVSQSDHRSKDSEADSARVGRLADGLMELWHNTSRTAIVLTCFDDTWNRIHQAALGSSMDRFGREQPLKPILDAEVAKALIESYLSSRFRDLDFAPPNPLWPLDPACLTEAVGFTPRLLLQRIRDHALACLRDDEARILRSLKETESVSPIVRHEPEPEPEANGFEAMFEQQLQLVEIGPALDHAKGHLSMANLLRAGLEAWIRERPEERDDFSVDPVPADGSGYNACIRQAVNEAEGIERRWYLRSVSSRHHSALGWAIHNLRRVSGLGEGNSDERPVLLRTADWDLKGPNSQTRIGLQRFEDDGGLVVEASEDDLRTFAALGQLLRGFGDDPGFGAWLRDAQPAGGTTLLRSVLGRAEVPKQREPEAVDPVEELEEDPFVRFGTEIGTDVEVTSPLEGLRYHLLAVAGTGSGKSVLLRRVVEECAVAGVSSIVLDLNNDLARLGSAWPEPPENWLAGDSERAERYISGTDVVIWTPGVPEGRPLAFPVLPDFPALNQVSEFNTAIENTMQALVPRARINGNSVKNLRACSVLRQALEHFGRSGGTSFDDFLALLAALPDGLVDVAKAASIAAEIAENLKAVRVIDPLFADESASVDIAELLRPAPGKRARVSVVNFIGLGNEEQKLGFISQLQMALFAWVKRHPSERPLGHLLVMDEAQMLAPSTGNTVCSGSTLLLVEQARKYGLGLLFATQTPKNLHNRVVGSTSIQFFGKLRAPAQIEAAHRLLGDRDGGSVDVSRLGRGQFGAVIPEAPVRQVEVAMCLSHHPRSAPPPDEVIELARGLTKPA